MWSWLRAPKLTAGDLEIHVPISPTPHFFTMVHYLAASWLLNGGPFAKSRIVVTVGADQEPVDLQRVLPWSRHYPIEWHWLDRALFRTHSIYATALDRFRLPFRSKLVLLLDADTICCGSFLPLAQSVARTGSFAGLIAHCSPFFELPENDNETWWQRLAKSADCPPFRMTCRHSGCGVIYHQPGGERCPPYFNLGMLLAPAPVMTHIGTRIYDAMANVNRLLLTGFRCQLAVALAIQQLQLPVHEAPMRYNCPNDDALAARHRRELRYVRLFHYLRVGPIDKNRDFVSSAAVDALLRRHGLNGVNREFARHLRPIHAQVLSDGVAPRRLCA